MNEAIRLVALACGQQKAVAHYQMFRTTKPKDNIYAELTGKQLSLFDLLAPKGVWLAFGLWETVVSSRTQAAPRLYAASIPQSGNPMATAATFAAFAPSDFNRPENTKAAENRGLV